MPSNIFINGVQMSKLKTMAIAIGLATCAFTSSAVTYVEADKQMEQNLNRYGAGVANWEEAVNLHLTLADSHLYHRHAIIKNNPNKVMPLKNTKQIDLSNYLIDDVIPGKKIDIKTVLRDRVNAMNFVVMNKKGEILSEEYWNNTDQNTLNHIMSSHKSYTSMATFIAEDMGLFKMSDPVGKYIPELKGTEYGDVSIQQYADMTAGIQKLPDNRKDYHWGSYGGGASGSWDSNMATAMGYSGFDVDEKTGKNIPKADHYGSLKNFSEYLKLFVKVTDGKLSFKPGSAYAYHDLNTEVLGRVISNTSGLTLSEFFEQHLWSKGGFNSDMAMYVNLDNESAASGSANITTRDFAIGSYLMVNGGKNFKGEQVLPKKYVEAVLNGDEKVKKAWKTISYEWYLFPDAFYKNQWRTVTDETTGRTISTMIGVNGQVSAFDHETGDIIAFTSAYRVPSGLSAVRLWFNDVVFSLFDQMAKQK